jgi:Thaumarchaeal output domain 1
MAESTARLHVLPILANVISTASSTSAADQATSRIPGQTYSGVQALLKSTATPEAIVLHPVDAAEALHWAEALRSDERFALSPMFSVRAFGDAFAALTDGTVETATSVLERVREIRERRAVLPAREHLSCDERLLAFLYTRPERQIAPICDWSSEPIYRFPLIEAFAPHGLAVEQWLTALQRRTLIEPVALIDRIHLCSACRGAHLNFVDVCPQCAAIDIAETIFLHCHTCGHVAQQDAYLSRDGLGCPKCMTRLRHIGVDYDRALEAFSCRSCMGRFTEPEVRARCLHCHTMCRTEELQERRIESFRLSESGQLAARTGHFGELFALIDEFQCVHPAYFEQTLDFLLGLGRRHTEIEFGIACMKFANVRELLVRLPRVQVAQLIDGFAARLRELVRTTDMVLREDDEHCWLLLPQTPPAGLEVLLSRVRAITETGTSTSLGRLELAISSASSRELQEQRPEAKVLMAELRSRLA